MALRYRYSRWDGSQDVAELDADEVLSGLTDDLMNFGDLQHALRNLMQRGMRSPAGMRRQGLRDLLQRLRQQRRQALDRFDLGSVFDDIQRQIDEIVDLERDTLDERLEEAGPPPAPAPAPGDGESDPDEAGGDAASERADESEGGKRGAGRPRPARPMRPPSSATCCGRSSSASRPNWTICPTTRRAACGRCRTTSS